MPRAFSEKEKEYIHYKLINQGKVLLERHGILKTTVEDITRACEISKGAFYFFYKSKEELFFEICESVETEFRSKIFKNIFQDDLPFRESFCKFLESVFTQYDETPLLRSISQGDFNHMMRNLPEEKTSAHQNRDDNFSEEFYLKWREQGIFKDVDPKGFAGLLKLLFYLILHKQNYTEAEFLATKKLYINMLCDYLVK
jgi:AcrR family transcriptional regulator